MNMNAAPPAAPRRTKPPTTKPTIKPVLLFFAGAACAGAGWPG
jgi:hypothetical protein